VSASAANVNLCDAGGNQTCRAYLEIDVNGDKALVLLDTCSQRKKNIFHAERSTKRYFLIQMLSGLQPMAAKFML